MGSWRGLGVGEPSIPSAFTAWRVSCIVQQTEGEMLFSRKWEEEQKTAVYLGSAIHGQLPEPKPEEERRISTMCHIHGACVVLLFHYVNLKHEFNKWMNLINVKPTMHSLSKTKTQTLQNKGELKRESARQCLLGAAPQATGYLQALGAAGLLLVGIWLLCVAGPAEVLAIELVAAIRCPRLAAVVRYLQ